ncbi:MAG: CvpA family protein [Firmicutes bacterium]|nr:CvpA family protein [Bacillota bacterium]
MNEMGKYVLDGLVLFLMVFAVVRGAHKGFVQTIYHAVRWIVCIILAQILYPYVADLLKQVGVVELIQSGLEEMLAPVMEGAGNTAMIESLPLPQILKDILVQNDNSAVYELLNVSTLTGYVAAYLANMAVNILAVILLIIVLLIGSHLIGVALDIITKLPVIHTLNAVLGAGAGAVMGVFYVWVFGLVVYLAGLMGKLTWMTAAVGDTMLLDLANQFNPLLKWVMNFLA